MTGVKILDTGHSGCGETIGHPSLTGEWWVPAPRLKISPGEHKNPTEGYTGFSDVCIHLTAIF